MAKLETYTGEFIDVTVNDICFMKRSELVEFLELRGYACYDDEDGFELFECAYYELTGENATDDHIKWSGW